MASHFGAQVEVGVRLQASRWRMASALHVSCDFADALLVVGGNDGHALAAAQRHINRVDPASRGVPMRQVRL